MDVCQLGDWNDFVETYECLEINDLFTLARKEELVPKYLLLRKGRGRLCLASALDGFIYLPLWHRQPERTTKEVDKR